MPQVSDTRVVAHEPLLSPAALLDEFPLDDAWAAAVERSRPKFGPCSTEPTTAARDARALFGA